MQICALLGALRSIDRLPEEQAGQEVRVFAVTAVLPFLARGGAGALRAAGAGADLAGAGGPALLGAGAGAGALRAAGAGAGADLAGAGGLPSSK